MHQKTTRPVTLLTETFAYRGSEWHRKAANGVGFIYDVDTVVADIGDAGVSRFYVTPMLDQNVSLTVTSGPQAGTYFYSQDERQSVRTLTDSTGTVVARHDYTAFGEPIPTAATSSTIATLNRYTYTGRELNPYSGNFAFRYRVFSPSLGQFFTRDPIGYVDGMGLYGGVFAMRLAGDPRGTDATSKDDCEKCGPDLTDVFSRYLLWVYLNVKLAPDSMKGTISGLRTLNRIGMSLDFWYGGHMSGCATGSCARTVLLCGTCVRATAPNNILFGLVANGLSVDQADAEAGAQIANVITHHGSFEGWEQWGAYQIGYDLWKNWLDNPALGNSSAAMCGVVVRSTYFFRSSIALVGREFSQCKPCPKALTSVDQVPKRWRGFRPSDYPDGYK